MGWLIAGALALAALMLLARLASLRRCMREIADELDAKLRTDTNTPICISGGDRAARRLAERINVQLRALRNERRRLQNGDAELKTAVTNLSHDLRTPLTAISGYLDLLERENLPEPSARYLAIIRERAGAMKALTEELFRYSMIAAAPDEMRLEEVCLNDVLQESLAAFYGALTERGIEPVIELPDAHVVRRLDRGALRRVIGNILNNAIKYSDGDLHIALDPNGEMRFSNAARDLNPVLAQKLFDRFYTVSAARNSTGLGLSIARLLTEKMGGEIAADYREGRLILSVRFPGENEG